MDGVFFYCFDEVISVFLGHWFGWIFCMVIFSLFLLSGPSLSPKSSVIYLLRIW